MKRIITASLLLLSTATFASNDNILNLYLWSGEIPDTVIQQFERETHIKVNYATYDSNETMYAKFLAVDNPGYDIVQPSSYFIARMRRKDLLMPLDKSKITNWHYLNQSVLHPAYDPERTYSMPGIWGVTGIFVNTKFYDPSQIHAWSDFWQVKYNNKLLLIDDLREVFSVGLLSLGLSPNTHDPAQIKQAYQRLIDLLPNVKLFANDAVPSIIADDDAVIGMAWNGDVFSASQDNPNVTFIYPQDGFVVWADDFAIPRGAKHVENAYLFLNFIERPDINAEIIRSAGYPTGNDAAKQYLPKAMQESPILFPPAQDMQRAIWQTDMDDVTIGTYEHYWELLKLAD